MLPQAPVPSGPRSLSRGSLACVGGLLTLVVFVFGVALAAPAAPQKDEKKTTEPKKDKPGKDDPRKEQADKDKENPKKSAADKDIDEIVKHMKRGNPRATDEQLREQVRSMSPEQRQYMLQSIKQSRLQQGFAGPKPPLGAPMPPMFGLFNQNARLGARVEAVSATLAEQLDLPKGRGLVVQEVVPDSAAAKAGIRTHDVLLEVNGKAVPNRIDEFTRQLSDIKADATVDVVVMRKGKKETIKDVKLPEAKAGLPGFSAGVFPGGGVPGGGFPQGVPGGGFPQPGVGFPQPPGFGAAGAVVTTLTRRQNHFTLRHEEGSLIITLTGQMADGKPKMREINVQEGLRTERYESVDKVPERYQDKVKNLIELSEKSSVRIDIKSK